MAASQDRPPPPPKRPAPEQQQQPADDAALVTYKRRRSTSTSPTVLAAQCGGMPAAAAVSSQHWASWRETLEGLLRCPGVATRGGGGIQSCVRDALACNRSHSAQQSNLGKGQGAEEEHPGKAAAASSAAAIEDAGAARLEANKAMCSNALYDILVSEKFALLCHLLAGTFHVDRPDKVIDFEKIDARMRSGYYAQNPALFDDDIQQIWEKFEQVGRQMTNLASSLSIISRVPYQKPASGVSEVEVAEHRMEETSLAGVVRKVPRDSTITMQQLTPCDSGHSTIPKRTETPVRHDSTCGYKGCGTTVDGEQGLICDRCDAMYHFACVKLVDPDIKQVPTTWHCPACINDSLHGGDCAICDQLDLMKPVENPELASKVELADEREGSSVSAMEEDNEPDLSTTALSNLCKHCGTCEDDDKKFVICGHPYCAYKFYHIRCLKTSQLAIEQQKKLHCWYCPSCLCRGCFRDKDDDMIVMCDGCDDGYHTYCMKPVRHTIPKGKWYCTSCRIRRAREGMQKYENSVLQILGSVKHVSNANQSKVVQGGAPEK